jgi:Cellulase (glycosyl hydrolase family 5)
VIRAYAGRAAAVLVTLATAMCCAWLMLQPVPPSAVPPSASVARRDCPVADCSAYPVPAEIRGVALSSLENWLLFTRSAEAQIRAVRSATGKSWNGNAIRLQILQDKLVGPEGNLWSPGYFRAIERIVSCALRRHLTVILNAQTEPATGFPANEQGPTRATYAFWRHITGVYGRNPHVVFDLFNEPRCEGAGTTGRSSEICGWQAWANATWPLVRYVRVHGSLNQVWVEGRRWGSQLAGVPLLPCARAVAWCQGIVYSFHKPGCPWPTKCAADRAVWWRQFGYLAAKGVPVVNGEMTNYRGGYYWNRSTATMTAYLDDLHAWHIGVVAWSLQPGIMTATASLTSAVSEPQGAGRVFWRYFHGTLAGTPVVHALAAEGTGP